MSVRSILLRLDPQDPEEQAILRIYDATMQFRKQAVLRVLLKSGLRVHGAAPAPLLGMPSLALPADLETPHERRNRRVAPPPAPPVDPVPAAEHILPSEGSVDLGLAGLIGNQDL